MPINDIAVLIFSFVALCVFIFCAASIIVQLRIHDLKRLLQDDYDKARRKLAKDWEEAGEKYTNEISALKIEMKAIRSELANKDKPAEDLSSAAVLGTKGPADAVSKSGLSGLFSANDRLH